MAGMIDSMGYIFHFDFELHLLWKIQYGKEYTESPLLYKNMVILTPGGPGKNVVALDKMSGELAWSIDLDSAVNAYNSPVLIKHNGEDFFLLNTTEHLMMIRPLSGEVALTIPGKEGFTVVSRFHIPVQPAPFAFAVPVLHSGILYIRYREHLWMYNVNDD
jgi:outer membrane protein assembly factor BamB